MKRLPTTDCDVLKKFSNVHLSTEKRREQISQAKEKEANEIIYIMSHHLQFVGMSEFFTAVFADIRIQVVIQQALGKATRRDSIKMLFFPIHN